MKITILKSLSYIALVLTIVPSILVLAGKLDITTNKNLMVAGMFMWFITAPFWMNRKDENE